jgi:tetratricopeptide (TPR) repeat protein
MPWEELLSKSTGETKRERVYAYYAQAWLLVHYMRSDPARARMLDAAVTAISQGAPPAEAFWKATGWDSKRLNKEMKDYRRLSGYIMDNPLKDPPRITYSQLPASADDLFLDRMRLLLDSKPDTVFLDQVRRKAARYPGDRLADLTLARAEYEAGDLQTANAVIARRLAAEPKDYEILVEAGIGRLISGQRDKDKRSEHFRAARTYFNKAFALNDSDYRVLYGFALSRTVEPVFPSENDLNALLLAKELAPSFADLSMQTGLALLARGRREEAMRVLAPVANDPHGGHMSAFAKALVEGKSKADAEAAAKAIEGADEPTGPPPA